MCWLAISRIREKKDILLALVFGCYISVLLWLTLLSRINAYERSYLLPFWSYCAIISGDMNALVENIENIFLFIPMGFFCCLLFNVKIRYLLFIGVITSFFIESFQWLFRLGTFEIDDIINNGLGMLLGVFIFKSFFLKLNTDKPKCFVAAVFISCLITCVIFFVNGAWNSQKMIKYAALNNRDDGAINILVLNGEPGYVGNTDFYVKYLSNGSLSIKGFSDKRAWKRIGQITLLPGKYVFSGLSGTAKNTIAIELEYFNRSKEKFIRLTPDVGPVDEVNFSLQEKTKIRAYVGVYPGAKGNFTARPVIYRKE